MDAKRRKDLKEARTNCKALLDSIDKELADDPEEASGEKTAAIAYKFQSPEMRRAIQKARQRSGVRAR